MWFHKKPDRPQTENPEPKKLQANQLSAPAAASSQGTTQMNKAAVPPTGALMGSVGARLGATLHMKGEITGSEDLVIEGTLEGLVQLDEGKLTIGTMATVTADIIAGEVVVYGKVKGNVRAKGRIEIKRDGSVDGDLTMAQILIEDGAYFRGSVHIERSSEKEADNNIFPPAA